MTHDYKISGMTCASCVQKVKSELLKMGEVISAQVQLNEPQATITMSEHIPTIKLQEALNKAGHYTIEPAENTSAHMEMTEDNRSWLTTYKPILLIFAFIFAGSTLAVLAYDLTSMHWMQFFMAGFFLAFSFFKLLDLNGFADSYTTYDIIAKHWKGWAYLYGFIELGLGLAYLTGFNPVLTNAVTFVVMSISLVGVLQSVLNKRKIQCACLGAVFNLPMSTVTIIEDALMIIMSGIMLLRLI